MKTTTPRTASVLALSLLLGACGKPATPPPAPPPQVGVITAQPQNLPVIKGFVGRISPYRSADILARVSGVLLKRDYVEGSNVKQGQLLFQIDPAPLQATLDANLAALAQARATYANNKVTAGRSRALAPKGYISKTDLDNALAAERTSAAAVQAAQANVQSARINLGYANVTSPINGRAGQQQVTEGALVSASAATPLTTVNQIDPVYVNFMMSTAQLERARGVQGNDDIGLAGPNMVSVQVTLPDCNAYPEKGLLDFTGATVDPATGSVALRARISNPRHILLPGMYVTLKVDLGLQRNVYAIPQEAIQRDATGSFVMVVGKDGKVAQLNVTTGDMSGADWIITGGLKPGDRVIVSGLQTVTAGATAKATPWTDAARGGSSATPSASNGTSGS
ncbi:MAG: efflux RND transporter periplasmic adaptor subunit [Rhodanobacteraceae bacterium]